MPSRDERKAFEDDFETGMGMIWACEDSRLQRLLIDLAIYFSRFHWTGEPTWYADLWAVLKGAQIKYFLCSLNYETVLEEVGAAQGLQFSHVGEQEGEGQFLKPHGSCNYLLPETMKISNAELAGGEQWAVGAFRVFPASDIEEIYERQCLSIPPVMSLYEASKSNLVNRELVERMRRVWSEMVAKAEVILTIGVRPVLEDAHIWAPIIESEAPIWFVGGHEQNYDALAVNVGSRLAHVAPTFAEAMPLIAHRLGLNLDWQPPAG